MKLILHQTVERLRHFAMLLMFLLCAIGNANALTSDEINAAILSSSSTIKPTWETSTWIFSTDSTYLTTPKFSGTLSATLSMTFSSEFKIDLQLDRACNLYSNSPFKIVIDGEEYSMSDNSNWNTFHKILNTGNHTVHYIAEFATTSAWAHIKNLKLIEYKPLETSCVKDDSMPLTFDNDPDNPWLTYDGYIQSMDYNTNESTSEVSTTFTIDKLSLLTFEYINGNSTSNNTFYTFIDDVEHLSYTSSTWQSESVVLYPGTHTVKFRNKHTSYGSSYYSKIRNVSLTQNWLDVKLSQPGNLGENLLQSLGNDYLKDAEMLKISGSLNDDDWNTLYKLSRVKAIDLTDTDITTIPEKAFYKTSSLSTVMMPNTLKTIGENAFYGTHCHEIRIPSSVETIYNYVWKNTPLRYITFEGNSNLKHIGYQAFYGTRILEFDMPDSVTSYYTSSNDWGVVTNCTSLKRLHLSDGLTTVPAYTAYGCIALKEVHMPANAKSIGDYAFYDASLENIDIPESVTSIGESAFYRNYFESLSIPKNVTTLGKYAFQKCSKLKNLKLNSHCRNMNYNFYDCTALETITLPCATPPTITNNPFYNVTKSNVKLIVPDFALTAYGLDNYWGYFTNREAGDEASIQDYWAIRGNLTLNKERKMQGTPSVQIYGGGALTMDTDMVQNFNDFTYQTQESSSASFLSKSSSVTANSLNTNFYVSTADKWFFFSPVCDVNMSDVTYPSTDSWVIRYYDGERRGTQNTNSGNWKNVPANGVLRRGQGYIIQAKATGWLNMPVTKENQNIFFDQKELTMSLADNPSENEVNAGWNFVSNPYPCYYDVYYMNMQAPITVWTGSTYRAYALNEGDNNDDTYVLRPMQPFFVQKASTDLTATMPLVGRQVSTNINHTRAPKPNTTEANPLRNLLNLELVKYGEDEAEDYTRIVINEQASMGYERTCDASKFMSMDATVAQFFSIGENDTPMAINERPYDNGNVALGVYFPEAGETFTITATRSDRKAWLYDAETGIEQDLTEGDYMFTVNKSGYDYNRFSIRFSPVTNAVEKTENVKVKVTAGTGIITVTAPENANVTVYGTDGSMIASCMGSNEFNVAAGIYVIKVDGQTFKTIVK